VRIIVAAELAVATDAVLFAHHPPKLGAHLVTAGPVDNVAWRQKARRRKKAGGG
jgi:hypothetical protein